MLSKRLWRLLQLSREIWVRTTLIALLAVLAALLAWAVSGLIPEELADRFGRDAVLPVLNILASSMLAVVTFSLSVMVSAHRAAASQVTPRAHRLLLEDTTTQTVLATFLGAFIFALLALVLFRAGFYGERASVVVFGFTALVIVLVVVAILRWISHLTGLGSMDETMRLLESRARGNLENHRKWPGLGAACYDGEADLPQGAVPVRSRSSGFVRHVDVRLLQARAEARECRVFLCAIPGDWVGEGEPLAYTDHAGTDTADGIHDAFTFSPLRSFDQDPRFGVFVMAEIGVRALSPGINDPGTAIEVIGRLERMLMENSPDSVAAEPASFPDVRVRRLPETELIEEAFAMIARDGAGMVEVSARLMGTLRRMAGSRDPELSAAARDLARYALAASEEALAREHDLKRLHAAVAGWGGFEPETEPEPLVMRPRR
ncbi:DUF2254 domain-containing protein [Psychromarinibacter sp. C21-152]|uniref:DUF2254 domain-containing protein n=1 Tax=Psychromarinibacter sediminicola TaxID=3033385 RepID=A0AAE3NSS0_9RHOB|nr:DUF2254 domain-containing protein [Psychromarinibacter sediminicola]MDF0600270.1 DUF2254 domain-containing protein [Psychromarinibacter sediminicola]